MTRKTDVYVTKHCLTKLRKRAPEFYDGLGSPSGFVHREVKAALEEGRKAAHQPVWVRRRRHKSRRSEAIRAVRFVWDAGETRCYVLVPGPRGWTVVTVLVREEDNDGLA